MTISALRQKMAAVASTITAGGQVDEHSVKKTAGEVCAFYDANKTNYTEILRLANDMATECIQATTTAMVNNRFMASYACIDAIENDS